MRHLASCILEFFGKGLDERNQELAPKIAVSVITVAAGMLLHAYLPGPGEKAPEEIRKPTV
jgi:hypothetical protein